MMEGAGRTDERRDPINPAGIPMTLNRENEVFRANLMELLGHANENEGKFAIVKGDVVAGPYADYESALAAAYEQFGTGGFLVKKIERNESVMYFARDLR